MPTAGDEFLEHCLSSNGCVEMKWLRIKFPCERNDLFFVDRVSLRLKPIAALQVFEIPFLHLNIALRMRTTEMGCEGYEHPTNSVYTRCSTTELTDRQAVIRV